MDCISALFGDCSNCFVSCLWGFWRTLIWQESASSLWILFIYLPSFISWPRVWFRKLPWWYWTRDNLPLFSGIQLTVLVVLKFPVLIQRKPNPVLLLLGKVGEFREEVMKYIGFGNTSARTGCSQSSKLQGLWVIPRCQSLGNSHSRVVWKSELEFCSLKQFLLLLAVHWVLCPASCLLWGALQMQLQSWSCGRTRFCI